jgi:hypothetical protein
MKIITSSKLTLLAALCLLLTTGLTALAPRKSKASGNSPASPIQAPASLTGAWRLVKKAGENAGGATAIMIVTEGRYTVAHFDQAGRKFLGTYGGTYSASGGKLTEKLDFNTYDSTLVGGTNAFTSRLRDGQWQLSGTRGKNKVDESWEKINEKTDQVSLAGAWQIRQRADENGQMSTMQRGPRQTIKFMSPTRFQWVAFNNATRQFAGTGGGTYTTKDGKYTETIEFFSRDPNRVGMQLSFDFRREGNNWHHSGQSTTGNRINEVWEKE